MRKSLWMRYVAVLAMVGCAGTQRSCASSCASELGANWVIVKTTTEGVPYRCWMLEDVSVANESGSDGIYWQSPDGHLVHISGFYERVQVDHRDWDGALREVGLTKAQCSDLGTGDKAMP